ncbi:AAA family ATPase [Candidatus Palauibacter sp.]|uniref:AAA family ATPase n=1 Tax=Candidatus Palauibacter sp. TaxID=3101350 RepID=UPI003AF1E598
MLLILAYIHSHPRSVLLIDEPDAHLEILRQKQVYTLLRQVAAENDSQVVIATHSEVVYAKPSVTTLPCSFRERSTIFRTRPYSRRPPVLRRGTLCQGPSERTCALRRRADRPRHPSRAGEETATPGGGRLGKGSGINAYYERDNHPERDLESELERAEGAYGKNPGSISSPSGMVPGLRGLWIRDSDWKRATGFARRRSDHCATRYEVETMRRLRS